MDSAQMVCYPECTTVQYLLPCFVATFLKMANTPNTKIEATKMCIVMVHHLILSYEQNAFEQHYTEKWIQPYLQERRDMLCWDENKQRWRKNFASSQAFKYALDPLIYLRMLNIKSIHGDVLCDWSVLFFALKTRLETSLVDCGWALERNTKLDYVNTLWRSCSKFTNDKNLFFLHSMCR